MNGPPTPAATSPLAGWRIWVSRPGPAAQALAEKIGARGGEALVYPVLELLPSKEDEPTLALLDPRAAVDLAIFTSIPAARHALKRRPAGQWSGVGLFAVGAATARWLESRGLPVTCPAGEANSEALLALPQLADVKGKRILLPCAPDGRQLLIDSLRERGADARAVHVYRRVPAPLPSAALADRLRQAVPALMLVATSVTILDRLQILGERLSLAVASLPLITASPRIAERALALGFQHRLTASGAGNDALLQAMESIARGDIGSGAHPVHSDSI